MNGSLLCYGYCEPISLSLSTFKPPTGLTPAQIIMIGSGAAGVAILGGLGLRSFSANHPPGGSGPGMESPGNSGNAPGRSSKKKDNDDDSLEFTGLDA